MKHLVTCLFLFAFAQQLSAQNATFNLDTSLRFNQRYTQCERKWIVLPVLNTDKSYSFAFVYLDSQAGFTFDVKGNFIVGPGNVYQPDTSVLKNTSLKVRIQPGHLQHLALIDPKHFAELGIKPQPDWVKYYYTYTDTVAHNYHWGWTYNDLGESAIAINYLEPAYKLKPNTRGVEFELAFAYNVLERYDDAIRVLVPAIQNNPDYSYYYKELGYAYSAKKQFKEAIDAYRNGLQRFPDKVDEARGELAFNMAQAYRKLGDEDNYKSWMVKAKNFTPTTSQFYKAIIDAGF